MLTVRVSDRGIVGFRNRGCAGLTRSARANKLEVADPSRSFAARGAQDGSEDRGDWRCRRAVFTHRRCDRYW